MKALIAISVLLFIAAILLYFRGSYSDLSPVMAKVAYQAEGKTYLYSADAQAGSGETVTVDQVPLYKESSSFFIQPDFTPILLDAMLRTVTLSEKLEPSFDGYFSGSRVGTHQSNVEVRATEVLGQQETVFRLSSENRQGDQLEIAWTVGTSAGPQPLAGCEVRSFWQQYRAVPGETSYSRADVLVVSLSDLAAFTGASFDYDAELEVLTIRPGA